MKLLIAAALFAVANAGNCPNECSGRGTCNYWGQCTCYTDGDFSAAAWCVPILLFPSSHHDLLPHAIEFDWVQDRRRLFADDLPALEILEREQRHMEPRRRGGVLRRRALQPRDGCM